jgi:hypothetical protein
MATATEIATELYAVRSEIAALRLREGELVDRLAAEMETDRLELEDIGVFERRRKADRKSWDHESLRSELLRKVRSLEPQKTMDLATGEVFQEDPTEQAFRITSTALAPIGVYAHCEPLTLTPTSSPRPPMAATRSRFMGSLNDEQRRP